MCRKHLCVSWLVFLSFIFILGWANAYLTGVYDGDVYSEDSSPGDYFGNGGRGEEEKKFLEKREPAFTPYISVGALSNMQQFFENLKENLDSLEKLPKEEREALFPKPGHAAETETRAFRPPATAAYLHAIRNQKPSHKIRNFVANAEPLTLRGSNYYDPSYLWSGLGRRR